jgi:glutamyl-tRNA synthetase
VVTGPVDAPAQPDEDRAYLATAATVLDQVGADWAALTAALKEQTGRKGKPLFLPLRQALTGQDHGPEMAALLPLIGRDAALGRLRAAAA